MKSNLVSKNLKFIFWLIFLIPLFYYFFKFDPIQNKEYAEKFGVEIIKFAIVGVIGVFAGNQCAKWAVKVGKNPNLAYFFGFYFALIALLIYWIYYKGFIKAYNRK